MLKIYSADWCGYCQKAKQLLKETKVTFNEINIDENPEERETLKSQGLRTIPQVFGPNGDHIGGYEDLVEYLNGN